MVLYIIRSGPGLHPPWRGHDPVLLHGRGQGLGQRGHPTCSVELEDVLDPVSLKGPRWGREVGHGTIEDNFEHKLTDNYLY